MIKYIAFFKKYKAIFFKILFTKISDLPVLKSFLKTYEFFGTKIII